MRVALSSRPSALSMRRSAHARVRRPAFPFATNVPNPPSFADGSGIGERRHGSSPEKGLPPPWTTPRPTPPPRWRTTTRLTRRRPRRPRRPETRRARRRLKARPQPRPTRRRRVTPAVRRARSAAGALVVDNAVGAAAPASRDRPMTRPRVEPTPPRTPARPTIATMSSFPSRCGRVAPLPRLPRRRWSANPASATRCRSRPVRLRVRRVPTRAG